MQKGKITRRHRSISERLSIVIESYEPGVTVKEVASRYAMYPTVLSNWRVRAARGEYGLIPAVSDPRRAKQALREAKKQLHNLIAAEEAGKSFHSKRKAQCTATAD